MKASAQHVFYSHHYVSSVEPKCDLIHYQHIYIPLQYKIIFVLTIIITIITIIIIIIIIVVYTTIMQTKLVADEYLEKVEK